MHLTVTCDLTGARVYAFEVSPDMEMENFLALCQFEIRPLSDKPLGSLGIMHQGQLTEMTGDNLRKTLKDFNIGDNDIVMVATKRASTDLGSQQNATNVIENLVKAIKVPRATQGSSRQTNPASGSEHAELRRFFDSLRTNAQGRERLRGVIPDLVVAAEQNNFDDFMKKYVTRREEAMARQLAMLDPTNPEGQRLIAEQIEQENISYTQEFAMEHMPEAYIPVTMLFIKMKINGVEVKAFIDSGAQVSILSENIAKRCNLMRLVDKRWNAKVQGVGGSQRLLGKIHACQVQIENQFFPCNFDVLADRGIDVLLGLDILKRHRCMIDLKNHCLHFGDTAVTPFLPESEVPQIRQHSSLGEDTNTGTVEVDSAKLASLMALGFEEAAARAMLIQCGNDVEAAAANLFARQTAR